MTLKTATAPMRVSTRPHAPRTKPRPSSSERDVAAKAVLDNMAKLKALRLAREAAAPPAAVKKTRAKSQNRQRRKRLRKRPGAGGLAGGAAERRPPDLSLLETFKRLLVRRKPLGLEHDPSGKRFSVFPRRKPVRQAYRRPFGSGSARPAPAIRSSTASWSRHRKPAPEASGTGSSKPCRPLRRLRRWRGAI